MVKITGIYEGNLRIRSTHGPSGTVIVTDAPVDNHGKGESFSPTDLCAAAMASCMITIMGIAAANRGIALEGLRYEAEKIMSVDLPRRIAKLRIRMLMPAGIPAASRETLIRAANTCPVHHSLAPEIERDIEWVWPD